MVADKDLRPHASDVRQMLTPLGDARTGESLHQSNHLSPAVEQLSNFPLRNCSRKEVSLPEAAFSFTKHLPLFLGLDTLGGHLRLKLMPHPDHCSDDRPFHSNAGHT